MFINDVKDCEKLKDLFIMCDYDLAKELMLEGFIPYGRALDKYVYIINEDLRLYLRRRMNESNL